MIKLIKKWFTRWYYEKGYTINSIPGSPSFSFNCPKWVAAIAKWLFSYDDYIWERINHLKEKE